MNWVKKIWQSWFGAGMPKRHSKARLYVGNLNYATKDADLKTLFGGYGGVRHATVITDRKTGQSKGFGFVEMKTNDELMKAMALNGAEFMGRTISVEVAKPIQHNPGGPMRKGLGHRGPFRPRRHRNKNHT